MQAYLIGALLFAIGIAIFVFQNTAVVSVRFINWVSPEVSLAIVVLIAACFGAMITFMLDSFRYFKVAKQVKDLMNQNRRLDKELKGFKKESAPSRKEEKKAAAKENLGQETASQPPEA